MARPAQSMGGQGMRGRGRGRGMHPQKRMRLPMPSQPVLDRQVSKRRREDGDWVDSLSMYQSTPRIERMQVGVRMTAMCGCSRDAACACACACAAIPGTNIGRAGLCTMSQGSMAYMHACKSIA